MKRNTAPIILISGNRLIKKTISEESIRGTKSRSSFFYLNQGDYFFRKKKKNHAENYNQDSDQDLCREVKGAII